MTNLNEVRTHWPGIDAFYDERGGRRSPEYDFGVHNHDDAETHLPMHLRTRWRVSVIEHTGDVYAIDSNDRHVRLLGTFATRDNRGAFKTRMDAAFADWAGGEGAGRPFSWFAERIPDRTAEAA